MILAEGASLRHRPGAVLALVELDLAVPPGGFRWVTGPSGSGKSSLLRLLGLRCLPSGGSLEVFGVRVERAGRTALARLRRRIGAVADDLPLLPAASALDNVVLRWWLDGSGKDGFGEGEAVREATEMLNWLGLGGKLALRPDSLSTGERRRLAVARAVAGRPSLLLADEPTAGMGHAEAGRLMRLLGDLNRSGVTVLIASADEALVERFPGPRIGLERGRLVRHG